VRHRDTGTLQPLTQTDKPGKFWNESGADPQVMQFPLSFRFPNVPAGDIEIPPITKPVSCSAVPTNARCEPIDAAGHHIQLRIASLGSDQEDGATVAKSSGSDRHPISRMSCGSCRTRLRCREDIFAAGRGGC
jgi:hypothetical protein